MKYAEGSFHRLCETLHAFLGPVLSGASRGTWHPDLWKWG